MLKQAFSFSNGLSLHDFYVLIASVRAGFTKLRLFGDFSKRTKPYQLRRMLRNNCLYEVVEGKAPQCIGVRSLLISSYGHSVSRQK